jgi:hypothetical protein
MIMLIAIITHKPSSLFLIIFLYCSRAVDHMVFLLRDLTISVRVLEGILDGLFLSHCAMVPQVVAKEVGALS